MMGKISFGSFVKASPSYLRPQPVKARPIKKETGGGGLDGMEPNPHPLVCKTFPQEAFSLTN